MSDPTTPKQLQDPGEWVPFPIVVETRDGRVEGELELPGAKVRLAELANSVVGLSSVFSDMVEESAEQLGAPISCCAGCGACCRQLVPVSIAEALMLVEMIESMPEERRRRVERQFAAIELRLIETGLIQRLDDLDDPECTDEKQYKLAEEYFRLGMPCPFLENESCSIHQFRPSTCREYLVNSPAALCQDPFKHDVSRLTVAIRISEPLGGISSQLLKSDIQLMPLTLAMKYAREHPDERRMAWDTQGTMAKFMLHMDIMLGHLAEEHAKSETEFKKQP